jgi:hypothetical protein
MTALGHARNLVWMEWGTIARLKSFKACPGHSFRQSQISSVNRKKTGDKRSQFLKIESHWSIILQNLVGMDLSSQLIGRADQPFISKVTAMHLHLIVRSDLRVTYIAIIKT